MPLVKLAPPHQQYSTVFHETLQQGHEDALFQENYEDYPQDGVKNKVVYKFYIPFFHSACVEVSPACMFHG